MNLFKVFAGTYSDSNGGAVENQGPEATIMTLCSRLKSATMLADRRDAVRALKSLAKTYRREVGNHCLEPLIDCLCRDRNDHELIALCLDALCSIFSDADESPQATLRPDGTHHPNDVVSEEQLATYAEKLTKEEVFNVILACLEENDFQIRFPAIRLLISLLQLRNREVQQLVLLNPTAVARFMDLLSDVREVIRNDVLVLLIHLTRGNSSIQKIVVFENVFEKLFSIMSSEGFADGGVVTQDCLELLLCLIAGNAANQLLFREGSFIQHLVQFFDSLPSSPLSVQKTWTTDKTENFILLFQLIRHMVTPGSGQQQIQHVQKIALQCGLLKKIAEMLSEAGLPSSVLIEALGALGELCRDLPAAQDTVIQLSVPSMRPPRPLVVVLLMSLINDKQPLNLRLAILYSIQCLLYRNKAAQLKIIKGMCPETIEQSMQSNQADSQLAFSTSAGQLIVSGLMASDSPSAWLTAGVLIASLGSGMEDLRSELLRAQLALSLGAQPVTLLQQISTTLAMQKLRLSTRAGLLQLLCIWLAYCPQVVDALLADAPSVACLLSQISLPPSDADEEVVRSLSAFAVGLCILFNRGTDPKLEYNREKLVMLVRRRIGIETFRDALAVIASNESYAKCLRSPRPQPLALSQTGREDVSDSPINTLPLFTHEFCLVYKQLEHEVLAALSETHQQQYMPNISQLHQDQSHRSTPSDLAGTAPQNGASNALHDRIAALEAHLADRNAECEQLRRELSSYKMAIADSANEYRAVLAEKDRSIGALQAELMAARSFPQPRGAETDSSASVGLIAEVEHLKSDLSSLRQEQEDLLLLLSHQDARIARLREKLHAAGQEDSEDEEETEDDESDVDKRNSQKGPLPEVALGESAFGLSSPPQVPTSQSLQSTYQQPFYQPQTVQQTFVPAPPPPQTQPQQAHAPYYPSNDTHQQQQYPNYGYPYGQSQQSYYPYSYGNHNQQQSAAITIAGGNNAQNNFAPASVESYFQSAVDIGNQDFQVGVVVNGNGNGDQDSSVSSDSQNSQIRIQ